MWQSTMTWRVLAGCLLLCVSQSGYAWNVLGCEFGPDIPAFISCVNNASSRAVADASEGFEDTIEDLQTDLADLQNSPYLASLPGEQQALLALRQVPVEGFRACLADAGLQMGSVMSGAMGNPAAFTQARLNELMSASASLGGPMLHGSLARLREGRVPEATPQLIRQSVDHAYAALTRLAEEDPVARCAMPLIGPLEQQLKQAAIDAYSGANASLDQIVNGTVRPALDDAMTATLGGMLRSMTQAPDGRLIPRAPAGQRPVQRAPVQTAPVNNAPPPKARQQPEPVTRTPVLTSSSSRTGDARGTVASVQQKPLRTRSIRDVAQAATAAVMPDDVERIALAVFTERMLEPRRLELLTAEIQDLTASLGSGAAFDTTNLDKLIDELAVPSGTLATELGIEVARFYGHETIDVIGGILVDAGLGSAAAAEAVVMEVGGAICSIGDVFSGVPCAIIKGIVSFVYLQIALPLVNQGIMAGYHVAYEATVECAASAIRLGQDPALRSPAGCGSLGPLLRDFPTGEELAAFALPHIDRTRAALFGYQRAVRELAVARSGLRR